MTIEALYFFGCWDRVGHNLYDRAGTSLQRIGPFEVNALDGVYAPEDGAQDVTKLRLSHQDGWTILGLWDRSVDHRRNSNCAFIAEGVHTAEEMWAAAAEQYPPIMRRMQTHRTNARLAEEMKRRREKLDSEKTTHARDPARIERVLKLIEELWKRQPDLRLTQLIVNAADTGVPCPELYHLEDTELEQKMQKEASKPPIFFRTRHL